MDSEENSLKYFRKILREKLVPYMESINYRLSYDNRLSTENHVKSWVFRLEFQGPKTVEISNSDWRDYTEYFNIYVDSESVFTINILKYVDVDEAYKHFIEKLENCL